MLVFIRYVDVFILVLSNSCLDSEMLLIIVIFEGLHLELFFVELIYESS